MKWIMKKDSEPWDPVFVCPVCGRQAKEEDIINEQCSYCGVTIENGWEKE